MNDPKVSASKAPVSEVSESVVVLTDAERAEVVALAREVYCVETNLHRVAASKNGDAVAEQSFAIAMPFVLAAKRFRTGEFTPAKLSSPAPKMVPVKLTDPDSGETVVVQMEECDWCLPNASPMHPDNQRSSNYTGPINADIAR